MLRRKNLALFRLLRHKRPNIPANRTYSSVPESAETEVNLSGGRKIKISTGHLARFANGSAVVHAGDTAVMVTAVAKDKPSPGASFMPLTVDYRQKAAAAGRIPTNFLRRELGPTEREILAARLVDRAVRPLFPAGFRCETQLVCNMLALDANNLPDVQAINGASAALTLSDIPWNGPVGAVRLGLIDNEVVVNPTRRELQASSLDLIVAATKMNLVVMLEGRGDVVLLQTMQHAIKQGARECQHVIAGIEALRKATGGRPKRAIEEVGTQLATEIQEAARAMCEMRLKEVFRDDSHDKTSRDVAVSAIRTDVVNRVWSSYPDAEPGLITEFFNRCARETFRAMIFDESRRCDGRDFDGLRPIRCEVDLHKPLHGSALFQRGQTQVFATVSLDSLDSAMRLDQLTALATGVKTKNFFLHYEFPPYATGEIGRLGPMGRREMGHGSLAERGLLPTLPQDYPFAVRLTAEVLESNGSSSMASVCAGSMALMDAGVPVSAPAAGVAIGLVTRYEGDDTKHLEDYRLLVDLLGIEDYMGDMDMKVAGTRRGLTALQTDVKIPGLPVRVVMEALEKAKQAQGHILDIMAAAIGKPRVDRKDCWPVTERMVVEPHQRARLFGPGGVHMKRLYLETGVHVTQQDDESFLVFAPSQEAMNEAKEAIEKLMTTEREPTLEFGGIYTAKIVELRDVGVMVTLYPSMPATLLHNSQLDQRKIAHPTAIGLQVGQEIQVKYFGRDPVSGQMRLSRKVLQGPATGVIRNLDRAAAAAASTAEAEATTATADGSSSEAK